MTAACQHEWTNRGSLGDRWRECWLCGVQEDVDWNPCPHDCAVFQLADYARRRIINAAGDQIPDNIVLSDN